eukprot:1188649-Prorocentrum_minimum.AAC.2
MSVVGAGMSQGRQRDNTASPNKETRRRLVRAYMAGGVVRSRYGKQAVVVSIDPKKVWVKSPEEVPYKCVKSTLGKGPNGEEYAWYQVRHPTSV